MKKNDSKLRRDTKGNWIYTPSTQEKKVIKKSLRYDRTQALKKKIKKKFWL